MSNFESRCLQILIGTTTAKYLSSKSKNNNLKKKINHGGSYSDQQSLKKSTPPPLEGFPKLNVKFKVKRTSNSPFSSYYLDQGSTFEKAR